MALLELGSKSPFYFLTEPVYYAFINKMDGNDPKKKKKKTTLQNDVNYARIKMIL